MIMPNRKTCSKKAFDRKAIIKLPCIRTFDINKLPNNKQSTSTLIFFIIAGITDLVGIK